MSEAMWMTLFNVGCILFGVLIAEYSWRKKMAQIGEIVVKIRIIGVGKKYSLRILGFIAWLLKINLKCEVEE